MDWVKRNLSFVIGAAVAVALLATSGFYLFTNLKRNEAAREALEAEYSKLQRLHGLDPHPGKGAVDNIKLARQQAGEARRFQKQLAARFEPIPAIPPGQKVTGEQFSAALRRTLDALTRQAADNSVQLPPRYSFSFEAQKPLVRFDTATLDRVAQQLGEVKAIVDVLIAARVNSIENIRRERVSRDDQSGPQTDYLRETSETNELAVISTYEINFKSFSTELAQVVAGFANSPHGLVVKSINVEPASAVAGMDPFGVGFAEPGFPGQPLRPFIGQSVSTTRFAAPPAGRRPPEMEYGPGGFGGGTGIRYPTLTRPGGMPGETFAPGGFQPSMPQRTGPAMRQPAASGGLVTLIDEEPLSIQMVVNVIRLLPVSPEE